MSESNGAVGTGEAPAGGDELRAGGLVAASQDRPDPVLEQVVADPRGALEAVLMVVDEPLSEVDLATALRLPVERVRSLLSGLAAEYDEAARGFALRSVAGGWRFYSRHEFAPVVERFLMDGQRARLTQAALETLAVIAYRQPVSRARVGAVRGVNVDGVVRTLATRGLIEEVGVDAEHGAALYGTTPYFLERLGLSSLQDLPPLAPHLPEPVGEPDPGLLEPVGERGRGGAVGAPDAVGEPDPGLLDGWPPEGAAPITATTDDQPAQEAPGE